MDLPQGGLEGDISRSFVGIFNHGRANVCGRGSTGSGTAPAPEGWKYRYNAIALSTYHVGDCLRWKFDVIKILNTKHFVVFIFVWRAIIKKCKNLYQSKIPAIQYMHESEEIDSVCGKLVYCIVRKFGEDLNLAIQFQIFYTNIRLHCSL